MNILSSLKINNFPYNEELLLLNKLFNKKNLNCLKIVGGAVRNFILNQPINDFDLACIFSPKEVIAKLKENNIKYLTIGEKFGTITAIINNKSFEITSLRKDIKTDGRHAIVNFTKKYEIDAKRRDFTFNALYLDFNGNVIDYYNGLKDLENKEIKFIGNAEKRIAEDYLRILRFFRFYCYYAKSFDKESFLACLKYKENLKKISGERIKNEMFKILSTTNCLETLNLMNEYEILRIISDVDFENLKILKNLSFLTNNLNRTIPVETILAILIKSYKDLKILKEKWKLSNIECQKIKFLLEHKSDSLYEHLKITEILFLHNNKEDIKNAVIFNSLIHNNSNIPQIKNLLLDIDTYQKKILPINGNDLAQFPYLNSKNYNTILQQANEIFIKSDFTLSKKEILDKISFIKQ